MNRPAPVRPWPAFLLALAGVALAFPNATAQQPSAKWLQGTHAFRYILHIHGFRPLQRFEDLATAPSKSILIVLGDTRILDENARAVQKLVNDGCALLVATDHTVPHLKGRFRTWAAQFGLAFNGQPVLSPLVLCYQ